MPEESDAVAIPILFIGAEDLPILFVNQFVLSFQQNEWILSMGQLAPPMLLGTEEEQREQARELSYVPVKVVTRVGMTRSRLEELANLLNTQLQKFDERQKAI